MPTVKQEQSPALTGGPACLTTQPRYAFPSSGTCTSLCLPGACWGIGRSGPGMGADRWYGGSVTEHGPGHGSKRLDSTDRASASGIGYRSVLRGARVHRQTAFIHDMSWELVTPSLGIPATSLLTCPNRQVSGSECRCTFQMSSAEPVGPRATAYARHSNGLSKPRRNYESRNGYFSVTIVSR